MTTCEGLGPLAERTLLYQSVAAWHRAQQRPGLKLGENTLCSNRFLELLCKDSPGQARCTATSFQAVIALAGALDLSWSPQPAQQLVLRDVPAEERPLPPLGLDGGSTDLFVANAWATPGDHWLQLLWANLLGMGPWLWAALVGSGFSMVWNLGSGFLRAWSTDPSAVAAVLSHREPGSYVHPSAVVEGCYLGRGARVGAGSVLRGCILGEGALVEEMVILEGCVLGAGARVQRKGGAKFCVLEEAAALAGHMQLGVLGKGSMVKHGAALMDQALGAKVRVRVQGRLVEAPLGLAGVCVGPGAMVGEGIKIGPGRVIPAGLTILPATDQVLTNPEVPEGCTRARMAGNRLEPIA